MHIEEYSRKMKASNGIYSKEYEFTKEYLYSNCRNPQKVSFVDPYSGELKFIEVPCGSCPHCKQYKVNSWVTRAYAHCESFKNVYFVTLTYRSFSSVTPLTSYIMTYLKDALWHFDSFNSTHHPSWNPCVICQKHFQDFLKRLRRNTGITDLTYMVAYEYGHSYGRPHAHFIFFTNSDLTIDDIYDAWSLKLYYKNGVVRLGRNHDPRFVYRYVFGRVDFHDLVKNGSFDDFNDPDKKILVDNKQLSARNCFAYVCKYMQKMEYNDSRVHLAFNSLRRSNLDIYEDYLNAFILGDLKDLKKCDFTDSQRIGINRLYTIPYCHGADETLFTNKLKLSQIYETLFACYFGEPKLRITDDLTADCLSFKEFYCPKTRVSLRTPIGSLYAKAHIDDFLQGKFDRPSHQVQGYVLPAYFVTKAKQYLYRFRALSSASSSVSFVKSNCTQVLSDLRALLKGDNTLLVRPIPKVYSNIPSTLFNSRWCYKDSYTGERLLFYRGLSGNIDVLHYAFNRSSRAYCLTRSVPLIDFLADFIIRYEESRSRHEKDCARAEREQKLKLQLIADYHGDFAQLCNVCYRDIDIGIKKLQDDWNLDHNHLE